MYMCNVHPPMPSLHSLHGELCMPQLPNRIRLRTRNVEEEEKGNEEEEKELEGDEEDVTKGEGK